MNKKILSITIILILLSIISVAIVNAGNYKDIPDVEKTKDGYNREIPPIEKLPNQTTENIEQAITYTDIWVKSWTSQVTTSSSSWTDIIGRSIYVKYSSDLAITFSSEVATSSTNRVLVRVLIDGVPISPGTVYFASNQPYYQAHSFTFTKEYISPGWHGVIVQFASSNPEQTAYLWYRSLTVIANGYGH